LAFSALANIRPMIETSRTVAIARGADKGPLARQLGAHHYFDSTTQDVAAERSGPVPI
jgi:Zn-dependent alcohol dehydrogenase